MAELDIESKPPRVSTGPCSRCGNPVYEGRNGGGGDGMCGSCCLLAVRARRGKWGKVSGLPARADLNDEIDWVVGSMVIPDSQIEPQDAPSKWAAAIYQQVRDDEILRRSFFDTIIKARITPGDVKGKRGSVIRDADVEGGVGGGESEADRMLRLLGEAT
jgi:hypothetical protein